MTLPFLSFHSSPLREGTLPQGISVSPPAFFHTTLMEMCHPHVPGGNKLLVLFILFLLSLCCQVNSQGDSPYASVVRAGQPVGVGASASGVGQSSSQKVPTSRNKEGSDSKPRLPQSLWAPEGGQPRSYSVIIPSHNTASRITATLKSVEESALWFVKHGGSKVRAEIVIVDDASTDSTVSRVVNFIESRRKHPVANITWKLVGLQQNVLGGAARNFGVRESSGDIIFFCDSDDLYLPEHIGHCFSGLARNSQLAMVQTQAKVDLEDLHPEWKTKIEGTIPMTRCLWRKFHDFIEGFPEQAVFTRHQDVGYLYSIGAVNPAMASLKLETVVYKRYPGNSLDTQAEKFRHDPRNAPASQEERNDLYPVRLMLINMHSEHLEQKLRNYTEGKPVRANPLWAIFQYTYDTHRPESWSLIDVKKLKLKKILDTAEGMMANGRHEDSKSVFNIAHKFIYNVTEHVQPQDEPLFFVMSTSSPSSSSAAPLVGADNFVQL